MMRPHVFPNCSPFIAALCLGAGVWFLFVPGTINAAMKSPRRPVVEEHHGPKVGDDYRWLESSDDPAVVRWTGAQNRYARAVLDKLPSRPWIENRLERLFAESSTNYFALASRRGQLFLLKERFPTERPVLITLSSVTNLNSERVILDPIKLNSIAPPLIDWHVPSPDGRLIAVCLTEGGAKRGTLNFYETATGRRLEDTISNVNQPFAGGSAAWNADGSGVFYTRYWQENSRSGTASNVSPHVFFHKLGTRPEQDGYELGKELPQTAWIQLCSSPDGRHILASVHGAINEGSAQFLRSPSGQWAQIARFEDEIVQAEFGRDPLYIEAGRDNALYLLSREHAPNGKILRLPLRRPELKNARLVVPEGTNVIQKFKPTAGGLALVLSNGSESDFAFADLVDKGTRKPGDRSMAAIRELVVTQADEVLYSDETFTAPLAWWRYNTHKDRERVAATPLAGKAPADFGDIEVILETVPFGSSTKVPLSVMRKKGTRLTGDNPTILVTDSGFAPTPGPAFDAARRVWFDQGGIIAVANLQSGKSPLSFTLADVQNASDEFAACAEFLIRSNYTKSPKLAMHGMGNGALIVSVALTRRPELAAAMVSQARAYDLHRAQHNAAFERPNFSPRIERIPSPALLSSSLFHSLQEGTDYPAVLLFADGLDGPASRNSRQMAALLQAAASSKKDILLRTSDRSNDTEEISLGERITGLVDLYGLLFKRLGVDYSLVERGPWSGSITPTSAVVKAKLAQDGIKARLIVSKSPSLTRRSPSRYILSENDRYDLLEFPLRDLEPDTRYYYALELDGRLERGRVGEFRTFPSGPTSFNFAFASCARTGSTSDVFDRIRELRPLFYMNMGDFHYLDIQTNSRPRFRAAYDSVLASPQQADLYRHVPFVYMWDDHDFGGNNSDRRGSHDTARLAYEEFVPHYPLTFEASGPISQSFSVGRVKFILTDLRSARDAVTNRDDATKSMMGAHQKEWFKKELLEANGRFPLICWVSTVPWIGLAGTNVYRAVRTNEFGFIHHTSLVGRTNSETSGGRGFRGRGRGGPRPDEDHWSVFATERREIADFIKSNHIRGVCIVHGDSHMLAADDGSNSDYATAGGGAIPVMCAGPLDQDSSLKGGPYSQGVYRVKKGEGGFGLLTVDDRGDRIDVYFSGRNNQNEEKITLNFSVPATDDRPPANLVGRQPERTTASYRRRSGGGR